MEEGKEKSFEILQEKEEGELKLEEEKQDGAGDEQVLGFLDSIDSYLILLDSLSSTLRQGWFDLASARHSMGASRLNSALLDLKFHSASTSLQVTHDDDHVSEKPHFTLRKWGSIENHSGPADQDSKEDELPAKSGSPQLRHRGNSQLSEDVTTSPKKALFEVDDQVQKGRSRTLSTFGTLVSPKLRTAQLSFETALETLVEIANIRSSLLSAYDKVYKELNANKATK